MSLPTTFPVCPGHEYFSNIYRTANSDRERERERGVFGSVRQILQWSMQLRLRVFSLADFFFIFDAVIVKFYIFVRFAAMNISAIAPRTETKRERCVCVRVCVVHLPSHQGIRPTYDAVGPGWPELMDFFLFW